MSEILVAGWGAAQFSCDTDDFGPSPHSMCNFPFLHKGEMHRKCSHTPTPGADNPVCAQFYAWAKVEIILEQREVAFLSLSKICENLNFSTMQ